MLSNIAMNYIDFKKLVVKISNFKISSHKNWVFKLNGKIYGSIIGRG